MAWKVRRNAFGTVVDRLEGELDEAVQNLGEDLASVVSDRAWVRTGLLKRIVDTHNAGPFHVEVAVGWYLGRGFYSGFQEDGTRHQAPRPVVGPAAHEAEPIFASYVEQAIKRAVRP